MGSKSSAPTDSTTTRAPLEGAHKRAVDNTLAKAQDGLGKSFVGDDPLVAGTNENIDAGQAEALRAAQAQQGLAGQQANMFGQLGQFGTQQDALLQARMGDIRTNVGQNLAELLPQLRSQGVQAGQAGSSRQGIAEGIAARDASRQISQGQNQLLGQAQSQRLQALQGALGAAPSVLQGQTAAAGTIGGVGAQQRDIQNQVNQEGLMRQQAEAQRLQALSGIVSQQTSPFGTSQTQTAGTEASGINKIRDKLHEFSPVFQAVHSDGSSGFI